MKNKKSLTKKKIILIVLLSFVFLGTMTVGGSYLYLKNKLSNIKTVTISKDPSELGISPIALPKSPEVSDDEAAPPKKVPVASKITNILLLGVDTRIPGVEKGRSDAIMILTVDEKHNKLKLTSILRDSYVTIDGQSPQILGHAHAFGGPLLTLKTINKNYNMDISDYVEVNFYGLEKIIDYIGGVSIDITEDEIIWANYYIEEISGFEGVKPKFITKPGIQTLSGIQAVSYSRIRYVGNIDFQRTSRQRTVFTKLFDKLSHRNITDIPAVIDTLFDHVETSLKPYEIMSFATYVLGHKITTINHSRVPYDDMYHNEVIDQSTVLVWDKKPTIDKPHQFIFESN